MLEAISSFPIDPTDEEEVLLDCPDRLKVFLRECTAN